MKRNGRVRRLRVGKSSQLRRKFCSRRWDKERDRLALFKIVERGLELHLTGCYTQNVLFSGGGGKPYGMNDVIVVKARRLNSKNKSKKIIY